MQNNNMIKNSRYWRPIRDFLKIQDSRSYALILAVLASFLTPFVGSSITIALPEMASELSMNTFILGWIPTAYLLVLTVLLVPLGRLSDIYGRKKIFRMGIILFTLSSFLAGFSPTGEVVLVLRIIQGIGSAMIFANVNAIVVSVFPVMERGKALGIAITGAYIGLFLGPVLGGILTENLGWRSIFFFNVPLGIITVFAVSKLKEEWADAAGEKFDIKGTLILAACIIPFIIGLSQLPDKSGILLMIIGAMAGIIFYKFESRQISPLFDLNLFKIRGFSFNSLATLISYTAGYPIIFLLSLYLQYALGFNPQSAGLVLAVQSLFIAFFASYAGKLSDRKDPRIIAGVGMAMVSFGTIFLSVINQQTSIWVIIILLAVMGVGFALFGTPNTNMVISSVKKEHYGVASASISTMRVMGQIIGMAVALLIMNLFIGDANIGSGNMQLFIASVKISFLLFGVLCALAILFTWRGGYSIKSERQN